jgi:hypothetical protein
MHDERTFVALYSGRTVGEAQIVALSAEEEIVEQFTRLLPRGVLEKAQSRPPLRLVPELEPDPSDAA